MSVFLPKYGEPGHKKCNLNNRETKLFAHKWKLHYIAGFYHRRGRKWCLNSSLSHPPPPPQPKGEGLKKTGLVKGWHLYPRSSCGAGRGQTQGRAAASVEGWGPAPWDPFIWPWTRHLTSCYSCSASAHRLLTKWIQFLKTGYENNFCWVNSNFLLASNIFVNCFKFFNKQKRKFLVNARMLSCVPLFSTPWTVARQAPLSVGFPRQGY